MHLYIYIYVYICMTKFSRVMIEFYDPFKRYALPFTGPAYAVRIRTDEKERSN